MPVELSELISNERWVEVDVLGHTLQIAYRPGSMSLRRQAQIQKRVRELQKNEDADEEAVAMESARTICELVTNWDLTRQGRPIPVIPDEVANLPEMIINAMMEAIRDDGKAQAEEKKVSKLRSDASLPAVVRVENSQNGTRLSPQADTWAR